MKVIFTKLTTTSEGRIHEIGDTADVPDDIAQDLIRRKVAIEFVDEQEEDGG